MAKMTATENAQRVIDRAVQMFGGRGVRTGEIAESLYREIRALRIYEGATEVQKVIIARELLKMPMTPASLQAVQDVFTKTSLTLTIPPGMGGRGALLEQLGYTFDSSLVPWVVKDTLAQKGTDIFRSKGILAIAGQPNRYVFQGVHMLFDGADGKPWGSDPRSNKLIFIGRNLNRPRLRRGFEACAA